MPAPASTLATLAFLFLAMLCSPPARSRELAVEPDELIAVELAMVGVVPMSGVPVVVLRAESGAIVPIFIGLVEAQAILMAQRNVATPRPMTHDLTSSLIQALDATLERVIVDELRDGTYLGALELKLAGRDTPVLVDTRPSDGLALAVRNNSAIFVSPAVLEAGADIPFEGLGDDDVVTALGITVVPVTEDLRKALGLPDRPGVLVSDARGMASIGGLKPGSLILAINGGPVESPVDFLDRISQIPRNEKARISYWHEGEEKELDVPTDVPGQTPRGQRRDRL